MDRSEAWVVRYPLPAGHDEQLARWVAVYGEWQVEFTGAATPGPYATLTCTVGQTREAWRTGHTIVLEIPDPNRQAAARARRVRAEALRVARDRDEPVVLSFAELVGGVIEVADRAGRVETVRAMAPVEDVRIELQRRCAADGTASAAALPVRSPGYLDWVVRTFRAWPEGVADGEASAVYARPFEVLSGVEGGVPQGAREVFRVACLACGADPGEFAPSIRAAALQGYLAAHRRAWITRLSSAMHSRRE
jgi:hypothetical protein